MITEKIGLQIKRYRKLQNISQEELAFRSGVHRTYIASLELGKRNISVITLEKIVNALDVSFVEFFDFDKEIPL